MLLEEFGKRIKELKSSRYSVKILLSNNYKDVFEIKRVFSKYNYQLVELKDYQKNENSWFGVSTLLDIVKNLQKNSVVFGVSEIVRFYNDEEFFTFFRSLFEIEDSMKNIFIPLFGLKSRFNHVFFKKFHRKNEYNYIYIIDSKNEKYELFVVDFEVPFDNQLQTIKDWLEFYKKPQDNLICSPKPLVFKAKNLRSDDLIQVYKITNQNEFIEKYMHKKFPIDYRENDIEHWKRLIVDIKNSDIEQLLKKKFNLHSLTPAEILKEICNENDLYYKWLMKGYILSQEKEKNSYFHKIIKNSDLNDVLIEKVWFDIFDEYDIKYLSQRYEILKEFYKNKKPSKKIEEKLAELLKNYEPKIPILTGITQVEKEYIVKFYALNKVDNKYIKKYYNDLSLYIEDVEFVNNIEWVSEYFREYKQSKIKNKISDSLNNILKEKNKNQDSFFTWYTDTTFKDVSDFDLKKEKTLWIDGLGIEWVGIIKNYCLEKGYKCEFYLSKSKIPTITECNSFDNIQKTNLLDSYIHSQSSYQYPKSLIEEIDIIKNILNDYLQDELIIVSDHGFSAFCSFKTKINSFSFDEHEGRCAKVDDILNDKNYFSYDFECGRYLVSLNHTSLNNKTRREAHGGVTPEEVIVPIIKIYKSHKTINKPTSTKQKKKKGFVEEELF